MNFERDVFISYAHIDNLSLKEGEKGWVESFHRALEVRLSQLMGEPSSIWRDHKLQGNDFFGDEIVDQFPKTAIMISILSPRYIKSEWCTKEVREFYQKATEGVGLRIDNKSRIFKVIKTAIPYDSHPKEIADTLGYEFFVKDSFSGRIKELSQSISQNLEQLYWGKLDDIANDICSLLNMLKNEGETASIKHPEEFTVYLAETSSDLKDQYDMIRRELIRFGYRVVPDSRLPLVASEFYRAVEHFLDQSILSIHLIGASGGMIPEGSQESIVTLQNELAAQKSKTRNLNRLIWILSSDTDNDPHHNRFIHRIRTDDESQSGADLFETSIEDFKTAIYKKLNAARAMSNPYQTLNGDGKSIFLAETNFNMEPYREKLKLELIKMGYRIVPSQPLPLVYEESIQVIDNLLEQCEISIHLLGENYGVVPDKTDKSNVYLQYDRSTEKLKKDHLKRFVRIPISREKTEERMSTFIDKILTDSKESPLSNDFIIETSPDEFSSMVLKSLFEMEEEKRKKIQEQTAEASKSTNISPPLLFLVCDKMDVDHIKELEDYLFEIGCDVITPAFEGVEAELIADYQENLKACDAVLIYYGKGNELWIRSVIRDLTKIDGYGRTKPLNLKGIFLAPPPGRPKERLRLHDALVIDGTKGFSPGLMESFIEKLKSLRTI